MIQRFDNVLAWGQIALSTSATQVFDSSTFLRTPSQSSRGVQLTNNDAAITCYFGYDNTVSTTKYVKKLAPGEYWEELMGIAVQAGIWVIAASGTPNLSVARLG